MIIEEEDYLEHFGKKGMKWGTRREVRLQSLKKVGKGKGNWADKVLAIGEIPLHRYATEDGFKGAAKLTGKFHEERRDRILKGEHTVKDLLIHAGNARISDVLDRDVRTAHRKAVEKLIKTQDKEERKFVIKVLEAEKLRGDNPFTPKEPKAYVKQLHAEQKRVQKIVRKNLKAQQMGR
jgi:hypothetical protein